MYAVCASSSRPCASSATARAKSAPASGCAVRQFLDPRGWYAEAFRSCANVAPGFRVDRNAVRGALRALLALRLAGDHHRHIRLGGRRRFDEIDERLHFDTERIDIAEARGIEDDRNHSVLDTGVARIFRLIRQIAR